jgi:hypothetical protein
MNEQPARALGIVRSSASSEPNPMVDRTSDFLLRYWPRPAQIYALYKNQQDPGDLPDRHGRITLFLTMQEEALPRFQARSQIVGCKNMRLRKESLEHDIPQLLIGGIPVSA